MGPRRGRPIAGCGATRASATIIFRAYWGPISPPRGHWWAGGLRGAIPYSLRKGDFHRKMIFPDLSSDPVLGHTIKRTVLIYRFLQCVGWTPRAIGWAERHDFFLPYKRPLVRTFCGMLVVRRELLAGDLIQQRFPN